MTKKKDETLFGVSIKTLEKRTVDRFRYYFVYDFDKYKELTLEQCLGACKAFYKIECKLPLDQQDKDAISFYLHNETEKLSNILSEKMGIRLTGLGEKQAVANVERIRKETTITSQHLDIEILQVSPNEWIIVLIINLIF
jgi:hypothetical protein